MKNNFYQSCNSQEQSYQAFPINGELSKNLNLTLKELQSKIKGHSESEIFIYPLSTVKFNSDNRCFIQEGSAPNFQGDVITLCTCMHRMRTKIETEKEWEDIWICGIKKPRFLFYIMRVMKAFDSMHNLVSYLDRQVIAFKKSTIHRLGDLYLPKHDVNMELYKAQVKPINYFKPAKNHSHSKSWEKDIIPYKDKKTFYLVGDPRLSFIWSKPLIKFSFEIYPGWKAIAVGEFLL